MPQIIVEVSKTGKSKVDANGFTGTSCSDATAQIELVLGGNAASKKDYKPEFSMPNLHGDSQTNMEF